MIRHEPLAPAGVRASVLPVVLLLVAVALTSAPGARAAETPNGTPATAQAPQTSPDSHTTERGRIIGRAVGPRGAGVPRARIALFDARWNYLRDVRARPTGRFAFTGLPPGTYRLQATDGRPEWRTGRLALTDAVVRVRRDAASITLVRMRRGGFLTGSVSRGPRGKPAARALVRATDRSGRTFEVRADARGQFALGGLPPGSYRVWGYDRTSRWAGPGTAVPGLSRHEGRDIRVRLPRRAGGINGHLLEGGRIAKGTTWLTATNRRTGQWWTVRVRDGDLSLRGLAPGRYVLEVTGTDRHLGRTVRPQWKVRANRTRHMTLRLRPYPQAKALHANDRGPESATQALNTLPRLDSNQQPSG